MFDRPKKCGPRPIKVDLAPQETKDNLTNVRRSSSVIIGQDTMHTNYNNKQGGKEKKRK